MPRLVILNQVLLLVGALSLHATDVLSPQHPQTQGLLYYLAWLQCIGLFGLLITANAMLLVARHGWRKMPDAQATYEREGLYRGLPTSVKWQLLLTTILCLALGSWLAQQTFIAIQTSDWGRAWLPQTYPVYKITFFNACYGTLSVYVFEYFQDRAALSEARERMAQKLTAQAQLNLLRSQLDPHMLFNTLSNLYELIDDSPQQARQMLLHLIGFLRTTLTGSRASEHALSEEFKLAADYLSIMKIRMGDRLHSTLSLPEELGGARIPAMLLQPLIENAIRHGLERRKQGGTLKVDACVREGQLVLHVLNSGVNTSDVDMAIGTVPPSGTGFGLHYIRDRLRTLYGDNGHLDMHHDHVNDTTEVTLHLPLAFEASTS
ncbi:MAG TPA: histidine kinase [Aquabacterium sp.]|uniref:sensor histidine kinase n=1 Tax=Aquabacterium sp. TaxID=1872578 RepID=UPI002E3331B7|nr:histidine kinase [Aquabacterium sp.]HEX5354819.1 histidine kinase [Aquabacterium sp.]